MGNAKSQSKDARDLTEGRLLAKNSVLNLGSKVLPMAIALVSIPFLIQEMGTDRFGVLTLTWSIIGYFSLLDLGLGRALTYFVAGEIVDLDMQRLGGIVGTAVTVLFTVGLVGGTTIFFLSKWLVYDIFSISGELHGEALLGIKIMALAIPFTILSTGFRGFLAAHQSFKKITVIQILQGTFSYGGILLIVLVFSNNLGVVIGYLMILKISTMIAFLLMGRHEMPDLPEELHFDLLKLKELFSYGGWITVSNIINPIISQLDRFVIGIIVTMTAVTYYTTPFDLVHRLNVIPSAFVGVLFPAFSTSFKQNKEYSKRLFKQGLNVTLFIMLPVVIFFMLFADEILYYWLGKEFVINSSTILKLLAVGILFNNMAQIPFTYIQGVSRPDITAKIHITELIIIGILLWPVIELFGIFGAAILSMFRLTFDFIALQIFVKRITNVKFDVLKSLLLPLVALGLIFFAERWLDSIGVRIILYLFVLTFILTLGWKHLMSLQQKKFIKSRMNRYFKLPLV